MDEDKKPHEEEGANREEDDKVSSREEEITNEEVSTYQVEVEHPEEPVKESSENNEQREGRNKKFDFNFEKSLDETKSIAKDAILRPHSLIKSNRSISMETSAIILLLLAIIVGIFAYFATRNIMDNMFGGFGSIMGGSVGIDFLFKTMLGWILTFGIGYFTLYIMLAYFGDNKMKHKLLLTKYVIVNIPFVLVFCLVLVLFGLLMVEYFIVMYVFSLMLFGMIHIYLFLVNVIKPKFDLFWLSSAYLFVLLVLTYMLAGAEMPGL